MSRRAAPRANRPRSASARRHGSRQPAAPCRPTSRPNARPPRRRCAPRATRARASMACARCCARSPSTRAPSTCRPTSRRASRIWATSSKPAATKAGGHGGPSLVIRPEGAAQVALLGPPNAGKSQLHLRLTGSPARMRRWRSTLSRRSFRRPGCCPSRTSSSSWSTCRRSRPSIRCRGSARRCRRPTGRGAGRPAGRAAGPVRDGGRDRGPAQEREAGS